MACPPQRPHDAGDVGGPARHAARGGVERDLDQAVFGIAAHADGVGVARCECHDGAVGQRNRQRETQVVVGVLADQVDASRREHIVTSRQSSRRRWATLSGDTSLRNTSIADSEAARYFSLSAVRRIDINSTWK